MCTEPPQRPASVMGVDGSIATLTMPKRKLKKPRTAQQKQQKPKPLPEGRVKLRNHAQAAIRDVADEIERLGRSQEPLGEKRLVRIQKQLEALQVMVQRMARLWEDAVARERRMAAFKKSTKASGRKQRRRKDVDPKDGERRQRSVFIVGSGQTRKPGSRRGPY